LLKFAYRFTEYKMKKTKDLDFYLAVMLFVALAVFLSVFAPYRLAFKEQVGIFLWSPERIAWYFSNPAIISAIVGDWLTQFYIKNSTAVIVTLFLLVLSWVGLVRLLFLNGAKNGVFSLAMLPVVISGAFIVWPHYPLSALIGFLISIWASCLVSHIKKNGLRAVVIGVGIPVMFILAGSHALTFAGASCLLKSKRWKTNIIAFSVGIVVMLLVAHFYNYTFIRSLICPAVPNYILPHNLFLFLLPVSVFITISVSMLTESIFKMIPFTLVSVLLLLTTYIDPVIEYSIEVGTTAYRSSDWKEIRNVANKNLNTVYGLYYRNLSYAREGKLPDELLKCEDNFYIRNLLLISPAKNDGILMTYLTSFFFTDALLEVGDFSQAIDCALAGQTNTPGEYSSRMLRRLAEISVAAGDYDVATKYLNILSRTRNYRQWASDLIGCIERDSIPDKYLIWRSRASDTDRFSILGAINGSLNAIVADNPTNKVAIDYLMCMLLLDKNVKQFTDVYDRYWLNYLDQMIEVPHLYQEALLLNADTEESLRETINKYSISPEIVDRFLNLMSIQFEENTDLLKGFKDTYWYFMMLDNASEN